MKNKRLSTARQKLLFIQIYSVLAVMTIVYLAIDDSRLPALIYACIAIAYFAARYALCTLTYNDMLIEESKIEYEDQE